MKRLQSVLLIFLGIFPLTAGDRILGTLVAGSRKKSALDDDVLRMIEVIAIQAAQAGYGTFAAATPVTQSFTVNAAAKTSQTITFGSIAAQTVGTPLTLSATASSG